MASRRKKMEINMGGYSNKPKWVTIRFWIKFIMKKEIIQNLARFRNKKTKDDYLVSILCRCVKTVSKHRKLHNLLVEILLNIKFTEFEKAMRPKMFHENGWLKIGHYKNEIWFPEKT